MSLNLLVIKKNKQLNVWVDIFLKIHWPDTKKAFHFILNVKIFLGKLG